MSEYQKKPKRIRNARRSRENSRFKRVEGNWGKLTFLFYPYTITSFYAFVLFIFFLCNIKHQDSRLGLQTFTLLEELTVFLTREKKHFNDFFNRREQPQMIWLSIVFYVEHQVNYWVLVDKISGHYDLLLVSMKLALMLLIKDSGKLKLICGWAL